MCKVISIKVTGAFNGDLEWFWFQQVGGHHNQAEFAVRGKEPKDEVQIYTWMDATLRELTDLVFKFEHFFLLEVWTFALEMLIVVNNQLEAIFVRKHLYATNLWICLLTIFYLNINCKTFLVQYNISWLLGYDECILGNAYQFKFLHAEIYWSC